MIATAILSISLGIVPSVIIGSILICWYYQRRAHRAVNVAAAAKAAAQQITEERLAEHGATAERVVHGMTGPELGILRRIESELSDDHGLMRAVRRYRKRCRQ